MVDTTGIDKLRANLVRLARDDRGKMQVALTVHAKVKNRIFSGRTSRDSSGQAVGRYSKGYIRQRGKTSYGTSSSVILEGIAKTTPKGTKRGKNKYRTSGQMKEDFVVIKDGVIIGSGFNNKINFDKSIYVEKTYKKSIFELTKQEESLMVKLIDKMVSKTLNA